jgi:hypothetical protein
MTRSIHIGAQTGCNPDRPDGRGCGRGAQRSRTARCRSVDHLCHWPGFVRSSYRIRRFAIGLVAHRKRRPSRTIKHASSPQHANRGIERRFHGKTQAAIVRNCRSAEPTCRHNCVARNSEAHPHFAFLERIKHCLPPYQSPLNTAISPETHGYFELMSSSPVLICPD